MKRRRECGRLPLRADGRVGVRVTLDAANLGALEALKNSLRANAWRLDLGETRQNGERLTVEGLLTKPERRS